MAETVDAFLVYAREVTNSKIEFVRVHSLRTLRDRVKYIKDTVRDDGNFPEALAKIPDWDSGRTGRWANFVKEHLGGIKERNAKVRAERKEKPGDSTTKLKTPGSATSGHKRAQPVPPSPLVHAPRPWWLARWVTPANARVQASERGRRGTSPSSPQRSRTR